MGCHFKSRQNGQMVSVGQWMVSSMGDAVRII